MNEETRKLTSLLARLSSTSTFNFLTQAHPAGNAERRTAQNLQSSSTDRRPPTAQNPETSNCSDSSLMARVCYSDVARYTAASARVFKCRCRCRCRGRIVSTARTVSGSFVRDAVHVFFCELEMNSGAGSFGWLGGRGGVDRYSCGCSYGCPRIVDATCRAA